MKIAALMIILAGFMLVSASPCFAGARQDQTGLAGHMMPGRTLANQQKASDPSGRLSQCPTGKGIISGIPIGSTIHLSMMPPEGQGGFIIILEKDPANATKSKD